MDSNPGSMVTMTCRFMTGIRRVTIRLLYEVTQHLAVVNLYLQEGEIESGRSNETHETSSGAAKVFLDANGSGATEWGS